MILSLLVDGQFVLLDRISELLVRMRVLAVRDLLLLVLMLFVF